MNSLKNVLISVGIWFSVLTVVVGLVGFFFVGFSLYLLFIVIVVPASLVISIFGGFLINTMIQDRKTDETNNI